MQSLPQIAKIIGRKKLDCRAVLRANESIGPNYILLGVVHSTWKYTGRIWWHRQLKRYPTMLGIKLLAIGHNQGNDTIGIFGSPPK